jgi:rubrerythrin
MTKISKTSVLIAEHKKKCVNAIIEYNKKYDTYVCVTCNEYIEGICSDPDCEFCSNRPDKFFVHQE